MSDADRQAAALWGGAALGCIALAPFLAGFLPALPPCPFKQLTGWPCAGCGSTRALLALARLDVLAALAWNPLATAGAFAFLAGGFFAGLRALRGRGVSFPTRLPLPARAGALAAFAAGWLYLVLDGR